MSGAVMSPVIPGAPARIPVGGVLTPRMERLIRFGSVGSALIIAVSAMVLSYAGLHDLALDAQIHPNLALLVPIMVDGLQFVGSLGVVYSTLSGLRSWYPWVLMLMGVSVSAWGNWQAAPDDLTAKLLHASAPVILALVLEELLRVMRHKVQVHTEAFEAAQDAVELAGHAQPNTQPDTQPDTRQVTEADEAPVGVVDSPQHHPEPAVVQPITPALEADPQPEVHSSGSDALVDRDPIPAPVSASQAPVPSPTTWEPREEVVPLSVIRQRAADAETTPPNAGPSTPSAEAAGTGTMRVNEASIFDTDDDQDAEMTTSADGALPPYPPDGSLKEQVRAILIAKPDIRPIEVVRGLGKDASYTRKIVREVRAELDSETQIPEAVVAATGLAEATTVAKAEPVTPVGPVALVAEPTVEPDAFASTPTPVATPVAAAVTQPRTEPVSTDVAAPATEVTEATQDRPVADPKPVETPDPEAETDPFALPSYATR